MGDRQSGQLLAVPTSASMTSKLRRPQLFAYNNDGRRTLASYPGFVAPVCKKPNPLYPMEVGVASSYNGALRSTSERSPGKGLHVNFTDKGEVKERREKFLTAKYGSHQMSLIRKRLAVEMWLYDELQKLFDSTDKSTPEVEVDIDELLDMDDDNQRRRHLQEILCDAKKSPIDVKKFVDDLLERTKTL